MAQINKPSEYFNTKLYTGNNTSTSITGVGFQPDLTWFKRRDSSAQHSWFDSVRGVTKQLTSNLTNADTTITDALTSFDSDGFTLGVDSGNYINFNSATYVSWSWLGANGTASNTDGSITSTVSANTTSGFSIVSYTGNGTANSTIGHGLGTIPDFIIVKNRTTTQSWGTKNPAYNSPSDPGVLYLNSTNATDSAQNVWGTSASFTTSTFTVGDWTGSNQSGSNFIAYCWSAKQGYSKFGKYTGNGSTDGTFIYLGFKPAFVMIKRTGVEGWWMQDNKRTGFNPSNDRLEANDPAAEADLNSIDILSNGFKCRQTYDGINLSGNSYIYMAFAEEPLVGDNPATAR